LRRSGDDDERLGVMCAPAPSQFGKNLVKPPKPHYSPHPADSVTKINLEKWRVYPFQFAILKIAGQKAWPTGRAFFISAKTERPQ
jgi:hypothetical protein